MLSNHKNEGIARSTAYTVIGALTLAGLCLVLGSFVVFRESVWRYLLVMLGAIISGLTLLWASIRFSDHWWTLPCAAGLLGIALSLGLKVIIPSTSNLFIIGVVLAAVGLGFCLAANSVSASSSSLAVSGFVLFIALVLLLSGLGYAFHWISLFFLIIGFGLAIAALYFPMAVIYVMSGAMSVMSLLSAPSPENGLRLLLPALLITVGLTLLRYSRNKS
jgi:hypothetical protein